MANLENQDGAILKDGEHIGTVDESGAFVPNDGLHAATVKSVEKFLSKDNSPKSDGEPVPNELGDLDPNLIDWRKENWDKARFSEMYPQSRLDKIGYDQD